MNTMKKTALTATIAAALALLGMATANATTTVTNTFSVTASVASSCNAPTTTALAFGAYNPISGSAVTAQGTITVTCTYATPFTVSLNAGSTSGGTVAQRKLTNGTQTLNYNLYKESGLTTVWGDGTLSTSTQSGTGGTGSSPSAVSFTVYGQIPASQNVPVASYSDTITVTVSY